MQEQFKLCSHCGAQNYAAAMYCYKCGARYGNAPPAQPKQMSMARVLLLVGSVIFGGFAIASGVSLITGAKKTPLTAAALGDSPTPAEMPTVTPTPYPASYLTVVKSNWEKGGFGAIAMWHVTFKNSSNQPIGNIKYRTIYYSETGNQVDRGGVDSPLDEKIIQKVIPPKSTRTIEINDGFFHSQAHRASFAIVSCEFVKDSR